MQLPVQRALVSVSDKRNIIPFARELGRLGIEILSTGGTAALLKENGVRVTEVSEHTGFPEMMSGRLKTLHPKIHGGILGRRGQDDGVMAENDIAPIDMVVVNLYPFEMAIQQTDCSLDDAIENIDIGGPAMLRSAAKNHQAVIAVIDIDDYPRVLEELKSNKGTLSGGLRLDLAAKVFAYTAAYDGAIANYLGQKAVGTDALFPRTLSIQVCKKHSLRYGENPHQSAAFYIEKETGFGVANATQLQGKALSFNNIADTDAALECVKQFDDEACVIVKHANPCGVAQRKTQKEAYEAAYRTDPESAFGGIIAFNTTLQGETARRIIDQQFVEVVIAPQISQQAIEILRVKGNVRLLCSGAWDARSPHPAFDYKKVHGGLLIQEFDTELENSLDVVTERKPTPAEWADLQFAWRVAKYVKSNAIVYVSDLMTVGVGAGQMSRVNSTRIAATKAAQSGFSIQGAVMASDAFFPFRDGLDYAAQFGIRAVIQPGGSINDPEVINSANEHGIAMVLTGMRHFRH